MKPVLEVSNLSFRYQKKLVLKDISFCVDPGEFVSVIGPNGCGKTTLIKTILNSIQPETGMIRIMGQELKTLSSNALARYVAVVMQTINPAAMTVKDYVQLGRLPFFKKYQFFETQGDVEIAEKYMQLTGVANLGESRINEISGGQLQLASIARALTQEPSLLVLDEPTSHLDITHQVRILELINTLKKELSLTVLMVLHDLNLAAEYSDRLVLLSKQEGRIFKTGKPEAVLTEASIQAVYDTRVKVRPNPVSQKPWVLLVNEQAMENKKIYKDK
ncbi:MAG: ABC transporter ATP-binding protein [Proteobacteria bacterium]|nr:ABC transporter ATP-binding protein [Pseudomonadota bacterium]MBU1581193.1 ABC transporter ATP-binding protein [Pseudomonadota bacterium]MBU2628055.1 ABC transporter ATP-binding protein [Pseudomonadota bacterium]